MSETTSESGQAHLADEPSMEDILDSIRKIIADDDQTMDISPPQALDVESSRNQTSEIDPAMSPASLVTDTVLAPSADYDENSVFHGQRGRSPRDEGVSNDIIDDMDDTVDLDIEALLSEAQSPPESAENLFLQSFKEEDDLADMLDIQIPEQEDESLSVGSEAQGLTLEEDADDVLDLSNQIDVASVEDSDDDTLFDELEGLLADAPQNETPQAEAGLAEPQAADETFEIEDLDELLEEAAAEPQAASSVDTTSESPQSEAQDKPAFHSDEADMDMVKSLMADLTEPETDSQSSAESTAREDAQFSSASDEEIPDIGDILEENFEEDISKDSASETVSDPQEVTAQSQKSEKEADIVKPDFDDSDILDEIINMNLDNEMDEDVNLEIPEPETKPETKNEPVQAEEDYSSFETLDEDPLDSLIEESEPALAEADESEGQVTAQSLISSLMEIAGEAEHDAEEAEAKLSAAQTAAEQSHSNTDNTQNRAEGTFSAEAAETSTEDVQTSADVVEISAKTNPKETADMPKAAVNQDRILDEVSGEAASNAFASLNNMVEEKAIKAERGDRIGDLVMEALRPMLKEWLDEHLNDIVERAVTKEVQRISSGK
jgi:cell pole-organizing protein PopZ